MSKQQRLKSLNGLLICLLSIGILFSPQTNNIISKITRIIMSCVRLWQFSHIPFVLARLSSVSLLKYPVHSFYFVYQNVYNFTTVMIIMIYVSLEPLKYHLWFLLHYWKEIKFITLHCTNSLSLWQTFRHKRFVFFNDDNIYSKI